MTDNDFDAFAVELGRTAVALLYKPDAAMIDEYFKALARYPLERVVAALEAARSACDYMPRPVEIARLMGVGVEREPAFTERLALPAGRERRALPEGRPEKLTEDTIRESLADLRKRQKWDEKVRPPGAEQDPERLAFWDRVEALRKGEHL